MLLYADTRSIQARKAPVVPETTLVPRMMHHQRQVLSVLPLGKLLFCLCNSSSFSSSRNGKTLSI